MAAKSTDWRPGPTVCRCCLSEGCYKDISTEYFWMGKREVYAEMLLDAFNLTISYAQSGPNSNSRLICEPCISRLRDASDFKRQVQECEKTFTQYLDPGNSSINDFEVEVPLEQLDSQVKVEQVKIEREGSDDDDFDDRAGFDDDDDDMDDQPLTKLASKVPKKESVDLLDLLDNAKGAVKRKSSTKTKSSPAKKSKTTKKEVKATTSKTVKLEKKKKEINTLYEARHNAEVVLKYSTAYPFKIPIRDMVCVYCCETYEDPANYREHMQTEHTSFNVATAFAHVPSIYEYVKTDCTDLSCRICKEPFDTLESVAEHLHLKHDKKIILEAGIRLQIFKFHEKWVCAICDKKFVCLRLLSRHTTAHYHRLTCETCGKSYMTKENLLRHLKYSHTTDKICVKCKQGFPDVEARRRHVEESRRCWNFSCCYCGERFHCKRAKSDHQKLVHGKEEKTFPCPDCELVFDKWGLYRRHFITTHTNNSFDCTYCNLKFDNKRSYNEHVVTHTKEKKFECNVCFKTFSRHKNLIQHRWVHSEHKRFECIPCNKKFNQRVSWKIHMKSYHPEQVDF